MEDFQLPHAIVNGADVRGFRVIELVVEAK
jgi:hypothetical protein